jgi:hypothetical protein
MGIHLGSQLTRGEYQRLLHAGICDPAAVIEASDESILACLNGNGNGNKLDLIKRVAKAVLSEADHESLPPLPIYES